MTDQEVNIRNTIEYLERYIALEEKSKYNPMYYIDYPAKASVQACKAQLKACKVSLDLLLKDQSCLN